ncbi:Hpt domain-containing protein [Novispirillum sp. DQ9]|uniref:Hpt domain-containing protein n=1 Tax=Novispirillum sp. DQ9 TaxID=3398612 RepID=UPI003C7DCE11
MSGDKPEIIQPPSHLKDKVTVSATGIDLDTLEKAEQLIAGMQDSYLEWVEEDLRKLQALEADLDSGARPRDVVLQDIFAIAHDVKGQGGSFDYPLMTLIGNYLCRYIERMKGPPTDKNVEVVKVHISALRLVIARRMSGDGGKMGDNLIRGLEAAIAKTTAPKE